MELLCCIDRVAVILEFKSVAFALRTTAEDPQKEKEVDQTCNFK